MNFNGGVSTPLGAGLADRQHPDQHRERRHADGEGHRRAGEGEHAPEEESLADVPHRLIALCIMALMVVLVLAIKYSHEHASTHVETRPHQCATAATDGRTTSNIVAVLPCLARDINWLRAKLRTCRSTLSPSSVSRVLIFAPSTDLPSLSSLALPTHWALFAEDEVLPVARRRQFIDSPGWSNRWLRQQAIKLLSAHHHATGGSEYLLMLDSDTLCTRGWRTPLADAFIAADGRVRTCVEPLNGWHGALHIARSARRWNFSQWVDASPYNAHRGATRLVLGWTPQILSRRGLDKMEGVLFARSHPGSLGEGTPSEGTPPPTGQLEDRWERLAQLLLADVSQPWTEYATYFLALHSMGEWTNEHVPLSVCAPLGKAKATRSHGHVETPSRRCARPTALHATSTSRAVRGCLKVRADCARELKLELSTSAVPFVMANDHAPDLVNGSAALSIAMLLDSERHKEHLDRDRNLN
jgi:hypothetical protein